MEQLVDLAEYREFQRILAFIAKCRKLWPGARVTLRPEGKKSENTR